MLLDWWLERYSGREQALYMANTAIPGTIYGPQALSGILEYCQVQLKNKNELVNPT